MLMLEEEKCISLDDILNNKFMCPTTKVMLYSGKMVEVKDIKPGNRLMGSDGKPKIVSSKDK